MGRMLSNIGACRVTKTFAERRDAPAVSHQPETEERRYLTFHGWRVQSLSQGKGHRRIADATQGYGGQSSDVIVRIGFQNGHEGLNSCRVAEPAESPDHPSTMQDRPLPVLAEIYLGVPHLAS
jgi:hypothetical protein